MSAVSSILLPRLKCIHWASASVSGPCFKQPIRNRFKPDPGTLEQRLFRAITKPVIPPLGVTPAEKRIRLEEARLKRVGHCFDFFYNYTNCPS